MSTPDEAWTVIDAVKKELGYEVLDTGFRVRLRAQRDPFAWTVAGVIALLALVVSVTTSGMIAAGILLFAVAAAPWQPTAMRGLRVENGTVTLEGLDESGPLDTLEVVELTPMGLNLGWRDRPPMVLAVDASLGARAWLGEHLRQAVIAHGSFEDVPRVLSRLRGETVG